MKNHLFRAKEFFKKIKLKSQIYENTKILKIFFYFLGYPGISHERGQFLKNISGEYSRVWFPIDFFAPGQRGDP